MITIIRFPIESENNSEIGKKKQMEKLAIKAELLSLVNSEVESWLTKEASITDGYTYEHELLLTSQRIGKILLEQSRGASPKSRNKKNSKPVWGR